MKATNWSGTLIKKEDMRVYQYFLTNNLVPYHMHIKKGEDVDIKPFHVVEMIFLDVIFGQKFVMIFR